MRRYLPLTKNTDRKFNIDYSQTRDTDFIGAIVVDFDPPGGHYFRWINLALYPRLLDKIGEDAILDDLTVEDRLKARPVMVNRNDEFESELRIFCRFEKGNQKSI